MIKRLLPWLLLAACVIRLWLMPLPSSFWVDEAETVFVAHFGYAHPSLAIVPQVTASWYFWLPKATEALLGYSEVVYRLPSVLAMAMALFFIARLAARLIHPQAAWFAVFACLTLRPFNYEAANARPYPFGICVAAASLWLLVRWLDSARWRDALFFAAAAALLWRIQLIYWPIYLIFAIYFLTRILRRETSVQWPQAAAVAAALALALFPVAREALAVNGDAVSHSFAPMPSLRDLVGSFKLLLPIACAAGAWLLSRRQTNKASASAIALIVSWWTLQPLCMFAYSHLTGISVFSPRYLSVALPGVALAATLGASYFIPPERWRPMALALGAAVLIFFGQWTQFWPPHHNSDWRAASRATNDLGFGPSTPVILPSAFVEGKPPIWRPDYPLPGFLYCYLTVYPVTGTPYLLPFEDSPEARSYAASLSHESLRLQGHFLIYGGDQNVHLWRNYFASRPEFSAWSSRLLGPFGDVEVAVFER